MDLKLEVTVDEPTILKKKTAFTIRIRTVFSDTPNLAAIFFYFMELKRRLLQVWYYNYIFRAMDMQDYVYYQLFAQ
jgi:hypothetical protein